MYFAQGVPWGFMTVALIAYLADNGVGDQELGRLTGLVLLPWTFKLIWAPLIDTMTVRSMGRRRAWIIGAEILMGLSLLWLLGMGDLTDDLRTLGWMFFIHNCFVSLQDVATDALAVDILPANEQGQMNGLMWGAKLIGKAVGAGGMAVVMDAWGISAAVLFQFVILTLIMLLPLLLLERPGEKRFPWSAGSANVEGTASDFRSPVVVLLDLLKAFSLVTTLVFFVYGTIKHIGWGIVEVVTKTLYTQQLGWTFVEVSTVTSYAVPIELLGAVAGGYLADRCGARIVLVVGLGLYGTMALVFGASPFLWDQTWFSGGYLLLNPGVLAMGSVGFLALAMRVSWTNSRATVFTIYMTISNIGHVIGNYLAGPLRAELPYAQTMMVAGCCTITPLILLLVVWPSTVDTARGRDGVALKSETVES